MMRKKRFTAVTSSLAIIIACGAFSPAAATEAAANTAEASGLEEIVVTANRREETLQKSALAMVAFNPEMLRGAGLSQATDLNKLVQGLQIAMAGSTTQIYIRGVGDFSANSLANPGVAFNVDGVYVGRPEAVASTFYDVARLEVLKGPQGTLYGRNASGGAINLITNSPNFDGVNGTLNVDVGNYNLFHVDGAINIPLNDKVAVRAAFNKIKRDGYLSDGTSDDDQLAGRLKVLMKPSDDVSLLLSADGAKIRGNNTGYVWLPRRPGSSAWEGTASPAANTYMATFNPLIVPAGNDSYVHNNYWNFNAQLDWNLGFATLTVIPAYRHTEYDSLTYNGQRQRLFGKADQESLEVRLGNSTPQLKWVAGLYYFHEKNPGEINILVASSLLRSRPVYDPRGTSYAAFGEATLSVTDHLRLIAGGRYTTEKRTLDGTFFVYSCGADPTCPDSDPAVHAVPEEPLNGSKRFNSFTWKGGAEYDLTEKNMLYFTASTGFKSGGLTQTSYPDNVYQPEKILAFELGSRNRFLDDKLQVNLEAFHWTYKNQQVSFLTFDQLGNFNFLTRNAAKAQIYGLNADVLAKVTPNDTLHVGGEYDHSKYSNFIINIPSFSYNPVATACHNVGHQDGTAPVLIGLDCSGFPLAHAPKWTASADYTHRFDLKTGAAIEAMGAMRYSASTYISPDYIASELAPSFVMFDASLAYRSPERSYSITAYVRNIGNAKEYTGGQENAFAPPMFAATISPPRTFGARFNLNW